MSAATTRICPLAATSGGLPAASKVATICRGDGRRCEKRRFEDGLGALGSGILRRALSAGGGRCQGVRLRHFWDAVADEEPRVHRRAAPEIVEGREDGLSRPSAVERAEAVTKVCVV
jgi:hypothetical protein